MPIFGTPVTLDEFKSKMDERAKFYRDETIFASALRMSDESGNITRAKSWKDPDGKDMLGMDTYPMTKHGFSTFCQKLGIPYMYLQRCPPTLRATNFNYWIERKGSKELFVRFDSYPDNQDKIRAVLSDRYADLPNTELAKLLLEKANKDYLFEMRYEDHEELLIGQMVAKSKDFGVDDFDSGIHVRNSEIGLAKLTLEAMIYSRAHQSGIILREMAGFSEKHIGEKKEFAKLFGESIDRIMANIPGVIRNMMDLKNIQVSDVPEIIQVVCDTNGVKEAGKEALDRARVTIETKNLFDVVCIFMRAATDSELTLDEREELQRVGGDVVLKAKRYQRWL